jgi:hypothetical protein
MADAAYKAVVTLDNAGFVRGLQQLLAPIQQAVQGLQQMASQIAQLTGAQAAGAAAVQGSAAALASETRAVNANTAAHERNISARRGRAMVGLAASAVTGLASQGLDAAGYGKAADVAGGASAVVGGAYTGAMFGGPWGAVIGTLLAGITSFVGIWRKWSGEAQEDARRVAAEVARIGEMNVSHTQRMREIGRVGTSKEAAGDIVATQDRIDQIMQRQRLGLVKSEDQAAVNEERRLLEIQLEALTARRDVLKREEDVAEKRKQADKEAADRAREAIRFGAEQRAAGAAEAREALKLYMQDGQIAAKTDAHTRVGFGTGGPSGLSAVERNTGDSASSLRQIVQILSTRTEPGAVFA